MFLCQLENMFFVGYSCPTMEKRQHPRVRCEIESNFKNLTTKPETLLDFTTVQDISEGGLRFRMSHFLPVHRRLYFHLEMFKTSSIEAMTEVAWVREVPRLNCYEAGVRFVDFPQHYKNHLQNFVFERLTRT